MLIVFHFCCLGGLCENTFYVDYRTEDGSANAGSDYEYSEGTLVFKPGETRKEIKVSKEKSKTSRKRRDLDTVGIKTLSTAPQREEQVRPQHDH